MNNKVHDMTCSLGRYWIGLDPFDSLFSDFDRQTQTYPPYNVIKYNDDQYEIEMAVAGFEPDELEVSVHNGYLKISGERKTTKVVGEPQYIHRGLSNRQFVREFKLYEHITVKDVRVKNGVLTIGLMRELPEPLRPRRLEIQAG